MRRHALASKRTDQANEGASRVFERKYGFNSVGLMGISVAVLMMVPVVITISIFYRHPQSDQSWGFAEARVLEGEPLKEDDPPISTNELKDKLYDGLLAAGLDDQSCISRYQSSLYRKSSSYKPSSYLLLRLRKYEALHKRCGPYTDSYNRTMEKLKAKQEIGPTDCNYLVWISFSGLGNRILTLTSAFLYALLTNRVLLVDRGRDMDDLFCEPFPKTSWLLPLDFPVNQFDKFDQKSPESYGNLLKNNLISSSTGSPSPFLYLHLVHDYDDNDKLFFCEQDQAVLQKSPWLIMKSDNYFVPSLFLIPSFSEELANLFPSKETVFHHLGRYLFHPSNAVWGLITRYHEAYLANADEKIGLQIRVFDTRPGPFKYVLDQILSCALKEKLLPEVNKQQAVVTLPGNRKLKAVLTVSLNSGYFEMIRDMYWEYPTATGEVIRVSQPSHEGYQQTANQIHNRKAWAEMYLLSLTDVLVTSSWSTFGYVAQGLGGMKPWILYKPENETAPDPPCRRVMSMEPCFHAPPYYDCKNKIGTDTGSIVPYVVHCEDISWGIKLVDRDEF
ncbi:hypothetical protein Scep_017247 [Stephania cephalantha]|uniref:Fucosyltransferase n=1 Tax=Stephania cephalantha TaxID=152367 RepID=A0AAP0NUU6_9MAGN